MDVGAAALLQRIQAQGVTTNAGMSQLAGTFSGPLKSSMLSIIGPAALITSGLGAAIGIAKSFQDAFDFKARLDASTLSINTLLRGVRDSNEVWAGATRFANEYKLTQQETNDAIQASIRIIRSSRAPMEEILGAFARLKVLAPEKTFQDASRALSELQAGQVVSIEHLFNVPRRDANLMKKEIEGGADAVEVLNHFLDRTGVSMDAVKAGTTGAMGAIKDLAKAQEDLALAQAEFAQGPGLAILGERITATRGVTRLLSGDFSAMAQSITQAGNQGSVAFQALDTALAGSLSSIAGVQNAANAAAAAQQAQNVVTVEGAIAADQLGGAIGAEISAAIAATAAIREATGATEAAAAQSLIDAQNKETQTAQTELLEAQTTAAVTAFLRLNPTMTASQAASATAAAGLSPLIAQLIQATLRAREATQALASFNALQGVKALRAPAAGEAEGEVRGFTRSVRADQLKAQAAAAQAAAAAERDYQKEIGNLGPALARAQRELDLLPKGSEAAWNKMIEIERLKQQQASAARSKGAKAAGAAHLSDQQKLNNTLLADQDKANDQMEAAARAHGKRIQDIERRFQEASLAQQKANELSKRSSELDFLKSITSSELNATKEGRAEIQRINEQFYRDFAASQKAAQEGNLKQSEELAAQAKHRADVELQYANDIDKARRDKNASEVARLEALREKERQLLAEQEKQIVEGGDPNVKARQEALDEEERNFAEQQGKIGDSADAAAQRKIDAALRSGKAIEAENLRLQQQEAIINRIGAKQGAPSATGGTGTAPAVPPTTTAPTPGAPVDLAALAAALQGMADQVSAAVASAGSGIIAAEQATARAVRAAAGDRAVL